MRALALRVRLLVGEGGLVDRRAGVGGGGCRDDGLNVGGSGRGGRGRVGGARAHGPQHGFADRARRGGRADRGLRNGRRCRPWGRRGDVDRHVEWYNMKRPHMSLNLEEIETPYRAFIRKMPKDGIVVDEESGEVYHAKKR